MPVTESNIPSQLTPYYLQLELAVELLAEAPSDCKNRYTVLVEHSLSDLNKAKYRMHTRGSSKEIISGDDNY